MKKLSVFILIGLLFLVPCMAQNTLNDKADNIIGCYAGTQGGFGFKARISKCTDGTYRAKIYWIDNPYDKNGKKYLDEKNPDKSLRNTPCDQVVLISGLRYLPEKKMWGDTKVYDPQRGFKAKCVLWFDKEGNIKLKGTLMGISETVTWKRIKEK